MPASLRLATASDADRVAEIFTTSRDLLTFLPKLHTPEEDRRFIREHIITTFRVTVAERGGRILGYMADGPEWLEQLYIDPRYLRGGIGSLLLADAQARQPALDLWCFAANQRGRKFYEKHGFAQIAETDGSATEERCPDIRYRWER